MKAFLYKIYTFGLLSKNEVNRHQLNARNKEWNAIQSFIKKDGIFLDVGCGAGYSMGLAEKEYNCKVFGIDPDPMEHGVGRIGSNYEVKVKNIKKAFSENIPFKDLTFDTVYSSHVLEHVNNENKSLKEMKRVLKDDGKLILGVPTSTMSIIDWVSQLLFKTHIKLVSILLHKFINTEYFKWWELFIPKSHSFKDKTILSDLKHYQIKNWSKIIAKEFVIEHTILPYLYPFPDYIQFFKPKKHKHISSSVFFICKKSN